MDEFEEQRQLIAPMLRQAIAWHQQHPLELAGAQIRVDEIYLEGVQRPFLGFVDFAFMTPIDIDLKTTTRCPSAAPNKDHVRQVAIYAVKRGKPQGVLYVTDKKSNFFVLTDKDMDAARAEMAAAARSLERAFSIAGSRDDLIRMYPLNDHISESEAAKAKLAELGV